MFLKQYIHNHTYISAGMTDFNEYELNCPTAYQDRMFKTCLKYRKVGGKILVEEDRELAGNRHKLAEAAEMGLPTVRAIAEARRQWNIENRARRLIPDDPPAENMPFNDSGVNETIRSPAREPVGAQANNQANQWVAPSRDVQAQPIGEHLRFIADEDGIDSETDTSLDMHTDHNNTDTEEEYVFEEDEVEMGDIIPSDVESDE